VGRYTVADWASFEASKTRKHELRHGEFIEMAGASLEHNMIAGNLQFLLYGALQVADCTVLGCDQKIYIDERNGLYPDVVVVCGEPRITPAEALQNPLLMAEVLSPSTAADDRGEKFAKYRTIGTLQHYLLVEQLRPSVEYFQRSEGGTWVLVAEHHALNENLSLTLGNAEFTLPLENIYRRIVFSEADVVPETASEDAA
jgi:Uma2 family endonuclease